jgi:hypothetical protein
MRALGTLVGGALGALSVAATSVLCNGWAAGAPHAKVAAMTFILAAVGATVQAARSRDPAHDYAYGCCTMVRALEARSRCGRVPLTPHAFRCRLADAGAHRAVRF